MLGWLLAPRAAYSGELEFVRRFNADTESAVVKSADEKSDTSGVAMRWVATGLLCLSVSTLLACDDTIESRRPLQGSGGTAGSAGGGANSGGDSPVGGSEANGGAGGTFPFMLGADISSVDEEMHQGFTYQDTDGTPKSIFDILKNHGFNFIRLRAFVKPSAMYGYDYGTGGGCIKSGSYCDTAHTVAVAQAVKAAGMGIMLDLHYSDTWADPGKQIIPEDWRNASSVEQLAGYVQTYTHDFILAMLDAGARPDIVQIGNEITGGMLRDIPTNTTDCWGNSVTASAIGGSASNWSDLAALLKAGAEGIKSVDSSIKIMLHIENTQSPAGVVDWVTNASNQGVPFDVVGLSCYTVYQGPPSNWEAAFNALSDAFPTLSFVVAEYNGERTAANTIIYNLPHGSGLGTFFWEPTVSGSWGGPALFTANGSVKRANVDDFAEFDTIAATVGLK